MATEKLKFINILDDFENGKEIDLSKIMVEKNLQEIGVILDGVIFQLNLLETKQLDEVQYEIQKQYIKFFYGLLQCTSLELEKEDLHIANINLWLEKYMYESSPTVQKLYSMIDSIIAKRELEIIDALTNEFKNLPTPEEIEKLKEGLDDIFKDKSEGELKAIESILAFNDPNMKMVKDIITAPVENSKGADSGEVVAKG